jgi:hypothetical protein
MPRCETATSSAFLRNLTVFVDDRHAFPHFLGVVDQKPFLIYKSTLDGAEKIVLDEPFPEGCCCLLTMGPNRSAVVSSTKLHSIESFPIVVS